MITFGFDLGLKSIAGAICIDQKITHLDSLIFPEDYGSLAESRKKRSAARTRLAHRAREYHWWLLAREANIPVPYDYDLKSIQNKTYRVRAPQSEDEIKRYNQFKAQTPPSVILRMQLLEGHKLSGEDIFKAIHHLIQKRGYDKHVPWANKNTDTDNAKNKTTFDKDEANDKGFLIKQNEFDQTISGFPEKCKYPCYYEAKKLNLWNLENGISNSYKMPKKIKDDKIIRDRDLVVKELEKLLTQAKLQYPKLNVERALGIIPPKVQNKTEAPEKLRFYQNHESLLGQKYPKFENRAVGNCRLIPRFKAAKANCEEFKHFYYLSSLHKISVQRGPEIVKLTSDDIIYLFDTFKNNIKEGDSITIKDLKLHLNELGYSLIHNEKIEKHNPSGRCAYSKIALKILNRIYLGQLTPENAYSHLLNSPCSNSYPSVLIKNNNDTLKGLMPNDLDTLKVIHDNKISYEKFYIPTMNSNHLTSEEFIKSVPSPMIRAKLNLFLKLLRDFKKRIPNGQTLGPNHIVIEFVRDTNNSLLSKKIKSNIDKNKKTNEHIRTQCKNANLNGTQDTLKYKLWIEQNKHCLYSGEPISLNQFAGCEIDHILPRELDGGSQTQNLVIALKKAHDEKAKRTPFEWLSNNPEKWDNFKKTVLANKNLSKIKKEILLSPGKHEKALSQKGLQVTAYVEKFAQKLTYIEMRWQAPYEINTSSEPAQLKVWVIPGFITSTVASRMGRKTLLGKVIKASKNTKKNKEVDIEEADAEDPNIVKNNAKSKTERLNDRHHALDASVASLLPHILNWGKLKKFTPFDLLNNDEFKKMLPDNFNPIINIGDALKSHSPSYKTKNPAVSPNPLKKILTYKKGDKIPEVTLVSRSGNKIRKIKDKSTTKTLNTDPANGNYLLRGRQILEQKGSNRGSIVIQNSKGTFEFVTWKPFESYKEFLTKVENTITKNKGIIYFPYLIVSGVYINIQTKNENTKLKNGIYKIETIMNENTLGLSSYDDNFNLLKDIFISVNPLFQNAEVQIYLSDSAFNKNPRKIILPSELKKAS